MTNTRIVIDTNIFVSAFLGSKKAKFLFKEVFNDAFFLIMSNEQLEEIQEVLLREKFNKYITHSEVEELVALLSFKAIIPAIYEKIYDCRDKKDNLILEEAVYGNAQFIITGDEDLLVLNPYKWIGILTLNDFLKEIYKL
jgi:putative PIN family toxin of toxin-antitoxin system